jgi:hypothetical protein
MAANWTKPEDEVLRRIYPAWGTDGVLRELPYKSRKSVWMRASALRIRRQGAFRSTCPWSKDEDRVVVDVYPDKGADGVKLILTNRTHAAINSRAFRLGIARPMKAADLYPQPERDLLVALKNWRGPAEPQLQGRAW